MLTVKGKSDKGRVRKNNEDSFCVGAVSYSMLYAVVCDGMGGENGGKVASSLAVETIELFLKKNLRDGLEALQIRNIMMTALQSANEAIYSKSRSDESLNMMGTTCEAVVVTGCDAYIAHVGDSSTFRISADGAADKLTRDHSVVQFLVDKGEITAEQARYHPKRHYITRALGVEPLLEIDFTECRLNSEDRILICSDGLSNYLLPEQMWVPVMQNSAEDSIRILIETANSLGGGDNITAVVISQ